MSSDPLTDLGADDRARLEAVLVKFDLGWTPDRLAAVARELPSAGPFRLAALREMVKIDLERHARRGTPVPLQDYLDRFPELAGSGSAPTDLRDAESAARDTVPRIAVGSVHLPREFGRYRVIRPLGRGGMGGVYLARDGDLDRLVALKVPRFPPGDSTAVERFTREARAAANIDHPNVCRVYDVGRIDGLPYISMAYVDGPTLADVLRDGPLPARRAAEIARDVARALAEAHRRGVVHRDLKPANIMLQKEEGGRIKEEGKTGSGSSFILHPSSFHPVVTDFGLAARTVPDDPRLTAEGLVAGTPPYMAPEQIGGERAGPAGDVYGLGAVLFEMATGRTPFVGSGTEIFSQALSGTPPAPSAVRSGIDPGLDAIALKALSRRPWDRFGGMAEFADALDQWLAGVAQPKPRRRTAMRVVVCVGVLLVLAAGAFVAAAPWRKSPPASAPEVGGETTPVAAVAPGAPKGNSPWNLFRVRQPKNLAKPKLVAEESLPEADQRMVAVAFSKDGRHVYTLTADKSKAGVRRWDAATGKELRVTARRDPHAWATFSADGLWYLAGGGLPVTELRLSESGETVAKFPTGPHARTGVVSRDGRRAIIAVNNPTGRRVNVYDVATGEVVGSFASHLKDVRCVALSDDGKVAYSAGPERHAVWDVGTGKVITEAGENGVRCAAFLPRSSRVVFGYKTGEIASIDVAVSVRFGEFETGHEDAVNCLASFADGFLVVSGGADKSLRGWYARTGKRRWEVTGLAEPVMAVAFTPDGRRMVTASARGWTVWELRE